MKKYTIIFSVAAAIYLIACIFSARAWYRDYSTDKRRNIILQYDWDIGFELPESDNLASTLSRISDEQFELMRQATKEIGYTPTDDLEPDSIEALYRYDILGQYDEKVPAYAFLIAFLFFKKGENDPCLAYIFCMSFGKWDIFPLNATWKEISEVIITEEDVYDKKISSPEEIGSAG